MKMTYRILAAVLACLLSLIPVSGASATEEPGKFIVATIDRGLKVLNDPSLQGIDKFSERRQKLWETVSPVINFGETSKRALGRHWRERTSEEKEEFTEIFKDILKDFYLGKSDGYQGEKIVYIREIAKGNRAKVQTNFFTVDGKKVVIDFSMHKVDDLWRIYDIIIEGVSIVSNYRSQFNSIIAKSSFEELMVKLREKRAEISY